MKPVVTRRMYRRIVADYPSCYLTSQSVRHAVVRDISLNGFRITSLAGMPQKTMVMVRLWLPNQTDSLDIDQAIVRWVRGQEFGVQIVALSNEADFRLAAHIEQVLSQQPLNVAV